MTMNCKQAIVPHICKPPSLVVRSIINSISQDPYAGCGNLIAARRSFSNNSRLLTAWPAECDRFQLSRHSRSQAIIPPHKRICATFKRPKEFWGSHWAFVIRPFRATAKHLEILLHVRIRSHGFICKDLGLSHCRSSRRNF